MEIINAALFCRDKRGASGRVSRGKTRRVYKTLLAEGREIEIINRLFVCARGTKRGILRGHRSPVPWWVSHGSVIATLAC